jgi:hypothetical protein
MFTYVFFAIILLFPHAAQSQVLVVGGTTGGVAAAIQSARSGVPTVLVEETNMLGGMLTAAGVSCVDGNDHLNSGIWEEFRRALYRHYNTNNLATGWVSNNCFEPHVGDSIFKAWVAKEKNLTVMYGWYPDTVFVNNNRVTGVGFVNNEGKILTLTAEITIDATELGDVFAMAGAAYDLGMEAPAYSGEKEAIEKNNIIQDITWAAILKDYGKGADKTIAKPLGYDASTYNCSTAGAPCTAKPYAFNTQKVLDYGRLPVKDSMHPKYMLNWPIYGNDFYVNIVEVKPIKRQALYNDARNHTLGFIYFLQTTLGFKNIGLAEDELKNGLALIPYNREGRRLKGDVRFNINHIKEPYKYDLYKTGIAVGDYPVDHHHNQYPGKVPDIKFPQVPSFSIPFGALIPAEIDGLIVGEKGISVSNIANGSTRLQPVVLLTGQAAGIAAALCIKNNLQPRNVNLRAVQDELLRNKAYLLPFVDISTRDAAWRAMQKCGVLGIVKGEGKSEAWENKMFCYPDSLLKAGVLEKNLSEIFKNKIVENDYELISGTNIVEIINRYNQLFVAKSKEFRNKEFDELTPDFLKATERIVDMEKPLTRKQVCILLEKYLLIMSNSTCDLEGKISF